jgi:addiction module HigA family antidote
MSKYIESETVGTIIREEFLEPYALNVDDVANATGIPSWELAAVVHGGKDLTAEIGLRLSKYFGVSEGFFWGLQSNHNMRLARRNLRGKLNNIVSILDDQTKKAAVL